MTIRFKNSTAATTANPEEESLIKKLWPDQETYKREEQRRFEILLAHWDLPVSEITPGNEKAVTPRVRSSVFVWNSCLLIRQSSRKGAEPFANTQT